MRNPLKVSLICAVFLCIACQSQEGDILVSVRDDGLAFAEGRVYPLTLTDTSTATIFLATYLPTLDSDAVSQQQHSLNGLFHDTPLAGIHILNRPFAYDLVGSLVEDHQLAPQVFLFQDGPDVLDRLLLEEKGRPQLIVTSVSARLAMISERIAPEWVEEDDFNTPQLVVIIHHPNAGIQLMKFPY